MSLKGDCPSCACLSCFDVSNFDEEVCPSAFTILYLTSSMFDLLGSLSLTSIAIL